MSGAKFGGLSLAYIHAVKVHLAPSSPKLRRALPYFTSKGAGELIYTATPPPPKKAGPGGSPTLHLYLALAARKAEGEGYDESLAVTYTDGTEVEIELDALPTAKDVLFRVERKARELRNKDEALQL